MRVLLDNCVDVRFARLISGHEGSRPWVAELSERKLLIAAEQANFDVIVTTDKNIPHQQNMANKKITLITLGSRMAEYDSIAPLAGPLAIQLSRGVAARFRNCNQAGHRLRKAEKFL